MLGAFQCEYLGALFARTQNRIHFSAADGAERSLSVGQADPEPGEFAGRRGAGGAWAARSFRVILSFLIKSTLTDRPEMFARLPMNRRTGRGNSMMSVGVATI